MTDLITRIQQFSGDVTFESLRDFVLDLSIAELGFNNDIPEPLETGDYGRNVLCLHPFECVLINWPPGVESAIHHHKGLFGHVLVLEGELDDHRYTLNDNTLRENSVTRYSETGLMPEPDGVIHKLRNGGTARAITLHFYYPAIESFEGMCLFNVESGAVGVLGPDAKSASWNEAPGHFKEIRRNAFEYDSLEARNQHKSHVRTTIIPKPSKARIDTMNAAYFCEQAEQYDFSDFNQPNRRSYIERIDSLIAEDLKASAAPSFVLDVACGTGRRAISIREASGHDYELVGIDISDGMREVAASRNMRAYPFLNDIEDERPFDVATFLYAFGHLADRETRENGLRAIRERLRPNGVLYVDLFSVENKNEWGPLAAKNFTQNGLAQHGYEQGDIFYRKNGNREVAFLHYFAEQEARQLLESCGYAVEEIKYVGYAKNPGELVASAQEGNLFVKARRVEFAKD